MSNLRNFITLLPGPQSYCKCKTLCSPLTVEHVIPKSFIKNCKLPMGYANDLHNIYPCCSKMNSHKGSMIFGKDFLFSYNISDHTGALSRACLYMHEKYDLPFDRNTLSIWKELDRMYHPQEFEITRNDIIYKKTGFDNHFITNHLTKKHD
ncbi:endonuclease I [Indivirus ILV1]|uniref:Endonuclease I n=1 Tax=Indivirus ILV1 TaxID=1977633 RepID=A0A1V0SDU3_9VIRU|nr:endonuclease I [Indivirus ILV1]